MTSKVHALSFLFLFVAFYSSSAQIDTARLRQEIDALHDNAAIQAYLTKINKKDQKYRGEQTSLTIDFENLISISYFLNKFPYPKEEQYGNSAKAPRYIWVHVPFESLDRISFPLVLKAFKANEIDEKLLRDYFLRRLYEYKFDDDKLNDTPLDRLFSLLELNTSDQIPIRELVIEIEKIKSLRNQAKKEVWKWHDAEKSKTITANGERVPISYKTPPVEIFTLENCAVYFRKVILDNSYEPKELIKIGTDKYKFKDRQTDKYFEIDESGNLLYRNATEIFDEHKKI